MMDTVKIVENYIKNVWKDKVIIFHPLLEDEYSFKPKSLVEKCLVEGYTFKHGNILGVFFSPTGITYKFRQNNIGSIFRSDVGILNNKKSIIKFNLEKRLEGPGAGGIEIIAYKDVDPKSKLDFLMKEEDDLGDLIGSVGWLPREFTDVLNPIMKDSYFKISHYLIDMYCYNVYMCLLIWGHEKNPTLYEDLRKQYDLIYKRTNLLKWSKCSEIYLTCQ